MEAEPHATTNGNSTDKLSAWRPAIKLATILLIIFNTAMIIIVDLGTHLDIVEISHAIPYRGFFGSILYEGIPLICTLFLTFMRKDTVGVLVGSALVAAFYVFIYII
ncbi:MAG: hypothetical protein JWQ98_1892 [Chlorobi bacterium]|nr:hypothetical protein [Chlorobiota bacterium]